MRRAAMVALACGGCSPIFGLDHPVIASDATDATGTDGPRDTATAPCAGDDFNDNSLDTFMWTVFERNGQTVTETQQRLDINLSTSASNSYSGIERRTPLADDEMAQIELVQPPVTMKTEAYLQLWFDMNNYAYISKDTGNIAFGVVVNGVKNSQVQAFDASQHRFFRMQFTTGTVYLWTSADAQTWIEQRRANAAYTTRPYVDVFAGLYSASTTPGGAAFDNFKIVTPTCAP